MFKRNVWTGPSPLTRGSLTSRAEVDVEVRSIPAHAGQPSRGRTAFLCLPVHPRSRGAAVMGHALPLTHGGPSPLTRGSQLPCAPGQKISGSIPAHAGQPASAIAAYSRSAVHPRSRGAAGQCHAIIRPWGGPSPLTRGSRVPFNRRAKSARSIPAHAGQPLAGSGVALGSRVHPRSRGAASTSGRQAGAA